MSTDPRIGELIQKVNLNEIDTKEHVDIVVVGFPHDEGVSRNGGRPGAKFGPDNVRNIHLPRCGTIVNLEARTDCSNLKILDVGNVDENASFDDSHKQLRDTVRRVINHKSHPIPFVIGGGNDQSFSNAMGLLESDIVQDQGRVAVINIDAHLDVRERKNDLEHSGTPFRLLLEHAGFNGKHFAEFAAQGTQCSATHAKFVEAHGGRILWLSEMKRMNHDSSVTAFQNLLEDLATSCDHIFVSFDLDAVSADYASGVSCPSPLGLCAEAALEICQIAGKFPKVKLFDLSEYNPKEEGYRTGKLVANMFARFVMGYSQRNTK